MTSSDGQVRLWDPEKDNVEVLASIDIGYNIQTCVDWSRDGKNLAYSDPYRIYILDPNTSEVIMELEGHTTRVWSLNFSPDDRFLLSTSDDFTAAVWDLRSGKNVATMKHASSVLAGGFSPDQTRIATGDRDGYLHIWDASTYEEIVQLAGHESYVYSLDFSPDGERIATSSGDKTVRIWDTQARK